MPFARQCRRVIGRIAGKLDRNTVARVAEEAHDFNNIRQAITGALDRVQHRIAMGRPTALRERASPRPSR
jgi:hypothetical protein